MKHMYSSLDRCLFLLPITIYVGFVFVVVLGFFGWVGVVGLFVFLFCFLIIFFLNHDNSYFMGIAIFTKIINLQ